MTRITRHTTVAELAGLVSEHLRRHGINVVLSGGALTGIYSEGEYMSKDIDLITFSRVKELESALAQLGFRKGAGRHFIHPDTDILVEFPSGPVSVGRQIIKHTDIAHLDTPGGRIAVLTATDAAKDRLAGFIHWNDQQNLHQAKLIASHHLLDETAILNWAAGEGAGEDLLARISIALQEGATVRLHRGARKA